MLHVRVLHTDLRLDPSDLRKVLLAMHGEGIWIPAALASELTFAQLAGVEDGRALKLNATPDSRRLASGLFRNLSGDVFFRSNAIVFILEIADSGTLYLPRRFSDLLEAFEQYGHGFVVGAIAKEDVDVEALLDEFTEAFRLTISESLDGRKTRHMKFQWSAVSIEKSRIDALVAQLKEEGASPRFARPEMTEELLGGAEALAEPAARDLLREISRAAFVREVDMLSRRGVREKEIQQSLGTLKDAGLIVAEHLLQCRVSSAPLTRVDDPSRIRVPPISELKCGHCNKSFSEELLSEGYRVSDRGAELLKGSHWMTVWVTSHLLRLGIPPESIMWNLEDSGEEVDILADFSDSLWIMELKDREFGSGDAHPLNYRAVVRYRADVTFVVTTGNVSADAKRVFSELSKSASMGAGARPVYIEGLKNLEPKLREVQERISGQQAMRFLVLPSLLTGFNLGEAVSLWASTGVDFFNTQLEIMRRYLV